MTRYVVILGDNACGGYALYGNGCAADQSDIIAVILNNRDKNRDELKQVLIEHGFSDDALNGANALPYAVTGCDYLFSTEHHGKDGGLAELNMYPEVCLFG